MAGAKAPPEPVRAEGRATKELPAASLVDSKTQPKPEQNQSAATKIAEAKSFPESLQQSGKDQAGTSAKALVQSDHNTSNNKQERQQSQTNEPIGRTGNQKIESQPPPGQQQKPQEATYQPGKTTNPETRPEPRSIPIPIPIETHQAQKNQTPASAARQPETAPPVPQKDLAAKTTDAKAQLSDPLKQTTSDGKAAPEALQGKNIEPPKSSAVAGELGSSNSAGKEQIAHEPPVTKDSVNANVGTGKEFDVAHEATTSEASSGKSEPHSQIGHSEQIAVNASRLDGIDAIIEKDKDPQIDSTILPAGRKAEGGQPIKVTEGKQDSRQDKDGAEVGQKPEPRSPGSEGTAGGSMGAGFDSRAGRSQDKVEPSADREQRGEVFKTQDGKQVRLDLTNKETCKQLLDLINQIETNKFKPLDATGKARLELLLEVQDGARMGIKEGLQAFIGKDRPIDKAQFTTLLDDKVELTFAQKIKELTIGRVNDAQKIEGLQSQLKVTETFFDSARKLIVEAFDRITNRARASVPTTKTDNLSAILDETISGKFDTVSEVEKAVSEETEQIQHAFEVFGATIKHVENKDSEQQAEEQVDAQQTPGVTANQYNRTANRKPYLVKTNDTYASIAISEFSDIRLWQLIERVNGGSLATIVDDQFK
ncbi:MAG: hypothetical protein K2X81_28670, partial [Candidatus Obscuribacterales bacterium]|nr:hypothetical protein [Candidatus Obscuribacterales bacterium]